MASEVTSMSGINATVDWSASKSGSGDAIGAPGFEVTLDMPAKPVGVPPPMAVPIPTAPAPGSGAPKSASPAGGPSVHASAHVSFASQPAVSATGFPIIDGYDLVRAAGKGGMGVVYEAIQLATGRRVAIKLLPEAALASELARTRFAREVEVVARLQHPGIVPILDSGVRKGLYFYAMDFVDGEPLDAVMPPGKADAQKVAIMICEICDSVDYAHQRGVLHRDLKPGNVLVDKQGKPHLLDFGLAKQTGDSSSGSPLQTGVTISGAGQLLGTVAFMSPEQAAGNADQASVRSDVYSLGVMTYLLMTGKLPISMNGSLREVLTWIADREPTAPSKIKPELGKDIDAILLKSLEKSPDRRYATAGELAADLRRWLADEAILARPISTQERSVRWVRKNKTLAGTVAAATLALVVVSATLITRIVQERNRANAAAIEAMENAKRAEKNAEEAIANAERARQNEEVARQNEKKSNESLKLMRGIMDPAGLDSPDVTLLKVMDEGMAQIDRTPPDNPETEAVIREVMASVYRKLGRYGQAKVNAERAVTLRRAGASGEKAAGESATTADAIHNLAAILWWQRDYDHALPLYQESLRIRRNLYQGDHRDVALSMAHLGACYMGLERMDEAFPLYQDALEMRRRLFGEESEPVAQSLNNLAKWYGEREDFDKSEELSRRALTIVEKVRGATHPGTASVAHNLALNLLEQGKFADAKRYFEMAVEIRRKLYPRGHHLLAGSLTGLARAQLELGELDAALANSTEADLMYTKVDHEQKVDIADAKAATGQAQLAMGRAAEALQLLRAAKSVLDDALNPPAPQKAELDAAIGEALAATGDTAGAAKAFAEAVTVATRARGSSSRLVRDLEGQRDRALDRK
jgi:non-specific serine/threonine protein kinase/serine/threonine-protein kinase